MAKDMHQEEWDSATLTKLDIFEQYIHEWLNSCIKLQKNKSIDLILWRFMICFAAQGLMAQKHTKALL